MEYLFGGSKEEWNDYVKANALNDGGFLQSHEWGEFQESYGRRVVRIAIREKGRIVFGWQAIEMTLPLGWKYWYIPRPVGNQESGHPTGGHPQGEIKNQEFFNSIKKQTRDNKILFIRIDGGAKKLEKFVFRDAKVSIQPLEDLVIDIAKSEEELLAAMRPKTRYNIRVAQKHGVKISNSKFFASSADHPKRVTIFNSFFELVERTARRQGIRAHPKEYYKKMFDVLCKDGSAYLYLAQYKDKVIAAVFVWHFNGVATYLHGGFNEEYKNTMAPYLLHWQALLDAKHAGCAKYNFGGVSLDKISWEGITRFKTGFAPKTEFAKYGGVWDLPVRKNFYRLYRIFKSFR